jgi:hypothetical protein
VPGSPAVAIQAIYWRKLAAESASCQPSYAT